MYNNATVYTVNIYGLTRDAAPPNVERLVLLPRGTHILVSGFRVMVRLVFTAAMSPACSVLYIYYIVYNRIHTHPMQVAHAERVMLRASPPPTDRTLRRPVAAGPVAPPSGCFRREDAESYRSPRRRRRHVVAPPACGGAAGMRWRRRHAVAPPACGGAAGMRWRRRHAVYGEREDAVATVAAAGMQWRHLAAVSDDRTQSRTLRPVTAAMRWRRLAAAADEREDAEEHVDDVEVEVEGGEDVLLGRQRVLVLPPQHHLRVEDEVLPKEGTRQRCEDSGTRSAFLLDFFLN